MIMENQTIRGTQISYKNASKSIRYQVLSHKLLVGTKLSSIRVLTQQYSCNPSTIYRSLNELVSDGLVIRKRGNGYYVIDDAPLVQEKRYLELEKLTMKLFLTLGI